ncbi:MAG: L-threonylcarbamoyladenylate synthase [Mariprofundaceae bacterium]
MTVISKPFQRIDASLKLRCQRLAPLLHNGKLVACGTSTLPGLAAHPGKPEAVCLLQRFKQRKGPFLLLAASKREAATWVRRWTPALRKAMQHCWPGSTTIIFPGKPGLPGSCYRKGYLAIRVDGNQACRHLAFKSGGLLISSSLNRKGKPVQLPYISSTMRWHRFLRSGVQGIQSTGQPSSLLMVKGSQIHQLRRV